MFSRIIKLSIITAILFFGAYNYASASFSISRPSTFNLGLVSHWTFDGGKVVNGVALDSTASGNNANLVSIATSTFYSIGKIGQGFNFDGVNDRVNAQNISAWNLADTSHSFSLWFKASVGGSGTDFLLDRFAGGTPGAGYYISLGSSGNASFSEKSSDAGNQIDLNDLSKNYRDDVWHHFAATIDIVSKTGTLYVDGVNKGTDLYAGNLLNNNEALTFGNDSSNDTYAYTGLIDDVRVYNRALSAREIKALYNQGISKFNKTPTSSLSDGLVSHWTFDGGKVVNGVALDSTASGNNANLVNIATSTFYSIGKIGQGFNFDGINDYINLGAGDIISSNSTISLWFKMSPLSTYEFLFTTKDSETDRLSIFTSSTGRIIIQTLNGPDNAYGTESEYDDDIWHHLVFARNGNTITNGVLYIDNVPKNLSSWGNFGISSNNNVIGGDGASYPYKGIIDDVRVYNRALSAGEIKILYNMGK